MTNLGESKSLRDRCIEAAERAQDDWWEHGKADERTAYVVNAVLAEVAAWCDQQECLTRDEHGNFFGPFGWDHSSNQGASHAFDRVAAECRGGVA